MRLNTLTSFALLLATIAHAGAPPSFDTIPLKNRNAEDILPLVERMVPGAAVEAWDGRLIVRGSTEDLAQIRALVAELDREARQWIVRVRRAGAASERGSTAGVEVAHGRLRGRLKDSDGERADTGVSGSRVLDGSPAVIRMNADEVRVVPHARGDMVELRVALSRRGVALYNSTITIRPGAWAGVGGLTESKSHKGAEILARRTGENHSRTAYEVRVEPVPSGGAP